MIDKDKLFKIIDGFPNINGLVIGDVMLDIYEYCLTSESKALTSEKPSKRAYKSQKLIKALGGAGNVATSLASLGVKTSLIGITGNDEEYFKLRELSDAISINHFFIRDVTRPTTVKSRLFVDNEYLLRRDNESSNKIDIATASSILNETLHEISNSHMVILSDYNKGIFNEYLSQEIIKECRLKSIPVIVDFKPVNSKLFQGADVLCPNEHEAKELMPSFSILTLETSIKSLFHILKARSIVITLGENGIAGFDGIEFFHIKGHKVNVLDAVGCGDTVRAGLALGITSGLNLAESSMLANFAAAVIVQKPNTASITPKELKEFIREVL